MTFAVLATTKVPNLKANHNYALDRQNVDRLY